MVDASEARVIRSDVQKDCERPKSDCDAERKEFSSRVDQKATVQCSHPASLSDLRHGLIRSLPCPCSPMVKPLGRHVQ